MTDLAVFVDGPLKGTTMALPPGIRHSGWCARVPPGPPAIMDPLDSRGPPDREIVLYRFRDYAVFGRVILVGSVARQPSDDDLFDVLLSDAARESARLVPASPAGP